MKENNHTAFEIEKTFGLGVLLKLTKKRVEGIKITTCGNRFVSNVSLNELSTAVDAVLSENNIRLKIG